MEYSFKRERQKKIEKDRNRDRKKEIEREKDLLGRVQPGDC